MPRVNLPHSNISRSGVAPGAEVNGDPVNFHSTANDGRVFLLVRNSGTTVNRVVTVHLPDVIDGQAITPRTYSLVQSTSRYIGPFPPGEYGDTLNVDVDDAELKLTAYHLG
jgi:hypothetical protein